MIHRDELSPNVFEKELWQRVEHFRKHIRSVFSENEIPYSRSSEGIRYFTFAGSMVNRAIGLHAKKPGVKADDLSLFVPSPVDWATIPTRPADYEGIFHLLFEASGGQSIYQQQLPLDLQQREYLQEWLKDTAIPRILTRLSRATKKEIDRDTAVCLG